MDAMHIDTLSHFVGKAWIREEQSRCSIGILDIFSRYEGPPLLIAQMQQGKTDVCIDVIDRFIRSRKTTETYEIIYLVNIADNDLKDQTDERILKTPYSNKVQILHHADLKSHRIKSVDFRLIIIDECHLALEKSSNNKFKPFHEFLKKCGVEYGSPISTWTNKNNFVLSVSATPYAHVIQTKLNEKSFTPVVLEMPENYYSLQHMRNCDRFKQSQRVVCNGRITDFFTEKMNEFVRLCETQGNGHLIVRCIGEAPETVERYIRTEFPKVDVRSFCSRPVNNIKQLDSILSQELSNPFVAIIRGCLRAGKTLTTTKHIRMWIEPPDSKTDTMCQVVGRCLGYEIEHNINRKFQDQFPVYCNVKELNKAIEFYEKYECIPCGVRNRCSMKQYFSYEIETCDPADILQPVSKCSEDVINDIASNVYETFERREKYNMYFANSYDEIPDQYKGDRNGRTYISSVNSQDLAKMICTKSKPSSGTPVIQIDAPNEKWTDSWNALINIYPTCIGKLVYFMDMESGYWHLDGPSPQFPKSWASLQSQNPELIGQFVRFRSRSSKVNEYLGKLDDKVIFTDQ